MIVFYIIASSLFIIYKKMKIYAFVNTEEMRKEDLEKLENLGSEIYNKKDLKDVDDLYKNSEDKIIMLQWTGLKNPKVLRNDLSQLLEVKNLKSVCLSTTGYSWIDGPLLRKAAIDLCNCPGKSTSSVAEFYFAMAISLLRYLPIYLRDRDDNDPNLLGEELTSKTVGIVGFGSIGKRFAHICDKFDNEIVFWNRSKVDSKFDQVEIEKVFKKSDVILISLAGNKQTYKIIKNKHLDMMKKKGIILNCAEKRLIDKEYVIELVKKGKIGGFGFESFEEKIDDFEENILAFPEIAYYTKQTMQNESRIMTDTAISYLKGKPVNVVN